MRTWLACLTLLLLASACRPPADPADPKPLAFDGEVALSWVVQQTVLGPRPVGSAAHRQAGDLIVQRLKELGWVVEEQVFEYRGTECRNLIGKMPHAEGRPIALLGAHYDTRFRADQDPTHPEAPVLGANDGASGVAVLLELARVLDPDRTTVQVWLTFFDAEDNGRVDGWDWIVGSEFLASQLTAVPQWVIVVDMVGDADQQIYYEQNSDLLLMEAIWQTAAGLGYEKYFVAEYRHAMLDDHLPFARMGIPAVDIIDFDYPYWHTAADTVDKVSAASLARVGHTLQTFLHEDDGHP